MEPLAPGAYSAGATGQPQVQVAHCQALGGGAGQQRAPAAPGAAGQRRHVAVLGAGDLEHDWDTADGLQQAGVQGLGGFRLTEGLVWISDSERRTAFEGRVGRCRFSGPLWVAW